MIMMLLKRFEVRGMEAFFYFVDGHGGSLILESVLLMILDEVCTMVNEF